MKIVGIASKASYLCEMDICELEDVFGMPSGGWYVASAEWIGREYDLRKAWKLVRELREQRDSLPGIAGRLRALADILQPIQFEIPTEVNNER